MKKIKELAQIFVKYKIYPKEKYTKMTPVGWFLDNCNDYYATDLKNTFFPKQDYQAEKRGADLPFWGKDYFIDNDEAKVFIITSDSLSSDAGSIVFYAHLFNDDNLYQKFRECFRIKDKKLHYKEFISKECGLDINNVYITDAKKVYYKGSCKDFDDNASKNLLVGEIEFCRPDIIIFLGSSGVKLLNGSMKLSDYYRDNNNIKVLEKQCFIFPFPTGNGLRWKKRYQQEIQREIEKMKNKINIVRSSADVL